MTDNPHLLDLWIDMFRMRPHKVDSSVQNYLDMTRPRTTVARASTSEPAAVVQDDDEERDLWDRLGDFA